MPGESLIWWRAILAGAVSLSLQVAVNFANDYSDGVRGTDANRVGPKRLTASGAASPKAVKRAALAAFLVAGACGLVLAAATAWWIVAVGAVAMLAAWYYTGGKRPYGYRGWGELSVFAFFGLVATVGSAYVQDETFTALAVGAAVPVGLFAVALLTINNLRDRPRDEAAGKRTWAVRLGDRTTRGFYAALMVAAFMVLPYLAIARAWVLIALAAVPLAVIPARATLKGAREAALIKVLAATARSQIAFGALLTVGLALA